MSYTSLEHRTWTTTWKFRKPRSSFTRRLNYDNAILFLIMLNFNKTWVFNLRCTFLCGFIHRNRWNFARKSRRTDMVERCLRDDWEMLERWLRAAWEMIERCLRDDWVMREFICVCAWESGYLFDFCLSALVPHECWYLLAVWWINCEPNNY